MQEGLYKTKDFHLLLGIHAGDGHLGIYKWRSADNSKEAVTQIAKIIERLFKIPTRILKDKREDCWFVEVTNKEFSNTINTAGFPYGRKINKLKIPKMTLSSATYIKSFLNGVFGCEATIYKKFYRKQDEHYLIIKIVMCDKDFIGKIANALKKLDFKFNAYSYKPSRNSFSENRRYAIT